MPLAANAAVPGQAQLHGTIDAVTLHQGTIINPTGLTLHPGMRVTILGNADGATFAANEIDTPYHIDLAQPPVAYWNDGPYWGRAYWGRPYFGRGYGGWF